MASRSVPPPRSDEDIKQDIIASLYWDTRVDAARIGVYVDNGHVTLQGKVPTYRAWRAAREDAWVISGVERVDNRVEVEISAELETPTDDELHEAVVEVLATDPDLEASDIDVLVDQGRVTLRGTVATYWEREMARIVAAALPGVRGMTNELVVVPSGDHRDATIAADIVAALERNRHIDMDLLDVNVENGTVTLSGEVANQTVHDQVTDVVRYTAGVAEIVDHLQVRQRRP